MTVLAHGGLPVAPHDLTGAWSLQPLVLLGLLASTWWYVTGVRTLWRSAGAGRVITRTQVAAFLAGVGALFAALVSPIDALGGTLSSGHMGQHLLLTMVAAPLVALAAPLQAMAWALPARQRRRTSRLQGRLRRVLGRPALPALGLAAFTLVFTLWHVPALYNAALRSELVHVIEHATMLAAALGFWWPVVRPRRTHASAGVLLLFVSLIASGMLAVVLVFAPRAWYAYEATKAWGLSPVEDQQLAGAVMWVLGGIVYVVAGVAVLVRWLRLDEQHAVRADHSEDGPTTPAHEREQTSHLS